MLHDDFHAVTDLEPALPAGLRAAIDERPPSHRVQAHRHGVIAGGGVAAIETALELRDLLGEHVVLTLVSPNLGPWAAGRTREPAGPTDVRRSFYT